MLAFFSPPVIFRICGSGCLKSFSGVWIHRYSVSHAQFTLYRQKQRLSRLFMQYLQEFYALFLCIFFKENILMFCIFLRVVADKIWHRLFIIHDQIFSPIYIISIFHYKRCIPQLLFVFTASILPYYTPKIHENLAGFAGLFLLKVILYRVSN